MKEFNIKLAKQGKPVCTRNGEEARIICFDRKNESYPIVAAVTRENGIETVGRYTTEGEYEYPREHNQFDLMMATEKHEGWMAIYKNVDSSIKGVSCTSNLYENWEVFDKLVNKDKVTSVVKIVWDE